ncbi:MAG TPA: ATP-binding protein [Pyrinomonadaceae bacterium]|nr:ATP-binding protein [Pyrinomonadaceae bacterium]
MTTTTELATAETEICESRVLVFMPTGRDALLVCQMLEKSGISALPCAGVADLKENFERGAGAVLMAEEALRNGTLEDFIELIEKQPVWSDIPVVLFAGNAHNPERLLEYVGARFNATIVERPIRIAILVSAVRGALRARQKQYQTRDLLEKLKESDHQKDMFLATLSHELRTPLNSILGWIQLLRGGNAQALENDRGLEVIERNARAQAEIISDILFVSRIITGKLTLNPKPLELIPVLEECVAVVLPSIEEKNIKLETFFDPNIEQINGDRKRLAQIFLNILSNAVKFTPANGTIDVRAYINGKNVEIEIIDSGIGIAPEFLPHIFERFRQADSSYTRRVGGLGLGLAIVRHLVELHGGTVAVSSEGVGRGSSFTIDLPVLPKDFDGGQTDEIAETNGNNEVLQGVRMLLVEDNADSREMFSVLFASFDLQVTTAASVAEAMHELAQNNFDVLISDIGMPGEDGYALIRKVRRLAPEKGGKIPAIALTGYASLQDRELALEAGYQAHLSKPVNVEKLLEAIKNLLDS